MKLYGLKLRNKKHFKSFDYGKKKYNLIELNFFLKKNFEDFLKFYLKFFIEEKSLNID